MKKLVSLLLCFILLFCLTGCGETPTLEKIIEKNSYSSLIKKYNNFGFTISDDITGDGDYYLVGPNYYYEDLLNSYGYCDYYSDNFTYAYWEEAGVFPYMYLNTPSPELDFNSFGIITEAYFANAKSTDITKADGGYLVKTVYVDDYLASNHEYFESYYGFTYEDTDQYVIEHYVGNNLLCKKAVSYIEKADGTSIPISTIEMFFNTDIPENCMLIRDHIESEKLVNIHITYLNGDSPSEFTTKICANDALTLYNISGYTQTMYDDEECTIEHIFGENPIAEDIYVYTK